MHAGFLRALAIAGAAAAVLAVTGAGAPAFPGASGRIFFTSDRAPNLTPQLDVVARDGSGATQLTPPTATVYGADWSPDGSRLAIVVSDTGGSGIGVVSASGGGVTMLTHDASDFSPSWSPDGARIAFLSDRPGYVVLLVMNADGSGVHRIGTEVHAGFAPSWSPDGTRIAYIGLDADPGDQLGGGLRVIGADGSGDRLIASSWHHVRPRWSPDGSRIVFGDFTDRLHVVTVSTGAVAKVTTGRGYGPVWSSDGKRIAFTGEDATTGQLFAMNADGSGLVQLTHDVGFYTDPAWSPDGSSIAVVRQPDFANGQVVLVRADGTGDRVVASDGPNLRVYAPQWSRDGSKLAYISQLTKGYRGLYSTAPDGTDVRQLIAGALAPASPAVSPDGTRIAFTSGVSGDEEIETASPDGTNVRKLTSNRSISDVDPTWSPDGAQIAFSSARSGTFHVYVMPATGGSVRRLTTGGAPDYDAAWSPDGSQIAFTTQVPQADPPAAEIRQIWTMRPDGTHLRRLDRGQEAFAPAWSPAGARIAYVATRAGTVPEQGLYGVFVANADGSNAHQIALAVESSAPTWSPDGKLVVFSDGTQLQTVRPDGTGLARLTASNGTNGEPAWQSQCTIRGTGKADRIVGTPGPDVICGLGGNDTIRGRGGADVILGGPGNDTLIGGLGRDRLFGGAGKDTLLAGDGEKDTADGGPGRDAARVDRHDVRRSIEIG